MTINISARLTRSRTLIVVTSCEMVDGYRQAAGGTGAQRGRRSLQAWRNFRVVGVVLRPCGDPC
ncbi:MAG: hypothetical protein M3417_10115 [Actinomycetota bacterium]|nr:hypothetical protein [Actinomycetota bacterium]